MCTVPVFCVNKKRNSLIQINGLFGNSRWFYPFFLFLLPPFFFFSFVSIDVIQRKHNFNLFFLLRWTITKKFILARAKRFLSSCVVHSGVVCVWLLVVVMMMKERKQNTVLVRACMIWWCIKEQKGAAQRKQNKKEQKANGMPIAVPVLWEPSQPKSGKGRAEN